jgi:hypothetical protein
VEWCCSSGDTSVNCTASADIVCSPARASSGDFAYTYCRGASDPTNCGVNSLELTATSSFKTINRTSFPSYVTVANKKSYLACYYHIKPESYKWKDGASIKILFSKLYDVNVQIFGGNSRTNASIPQVLNNLTVKAGQLVSVDASMEAVILIRPRDYRFNPTYFEFKFGIDGTQYPWYEAYFIGPDGKTYIIAAIAIASVIALILVIAVILCVVRCVNKVDNKVHDESEIQKLQPDPSS